jgi:hypothetical protein
MAFTLPTFDLLCNIFDYPLFVVPRLANVPCNLAWGRRVGLPFNDASAGTGDSQAFASMTLLLPKLTDVRDWLCAPPSTGADQIEVPAGSGRWYTVIAVDDIGKGFSNEHRAAWIGKTGNALGFWPTPIP